MAKRIKSRIEKLLATRMKRLRSIDGMNQIEASQLMGMKPASYSDIEACNKNINLNQLETIANGYSTKASIKATCAWVSLLILLLP